MALCDLDEFKAFNDTYGHLEGDHALRRVGQTLQLNSRGADGAYRYGGEEFVLVLTETTLTAGGPGDGADAPGGGGARDPARVAVTPPGS